MKYLILPMALISVFFVSFSFATTLDDVPQPNVAAKREERGLCQAVQGNPSGISRDVCLSLVNSERASDDKTIYTSAFVVDKDGRNFDIFVRAIGSKNCTRNCDDYIPFDMRVGYFRIDYYEDICPNPSQPDFTDMFVVTNGTVDTDDDSSFCYDPFSVEPEPEPDPNAKCDEFGNNSMLPPKAGVGSEGQNACYTNPSNGLSCQYVQGGDNFTATGKQCTGDENDYGDRPTPEPPPDGADPNCYNYGSQGQVLICDVDPNEGCNPIIINGTTQYQCPHGCGSIDDVYFCSYDDKDGDGIPDDKNGNGVPDKDETCVNGKCKPNTPDDTTPPTTEKPDMTETNTRLDGVIGELDSIGGKINKTNQTLNGINSGIQGIKQGQDKANGLLAGMSKDTGLIADNTDAIAGNTKGLLETVSKTDVGNTFNPDLSTGFYESSYENGFEGIWAEKSILFEQTETIQFLQQFRFNAGGSPPDTQLCFNMGGSMDFGCADLPTPSPQLLAILKIFILITAAFLCRALIFGG